MEPELSYGRHFGPPAPDARPAAVVVLLNWFEARWQLPLIVRPDTLSHHGGQIGLPGGLIEAGESSEDAALRELEEELGISRFQAMLLGQLSPIFLYGTNFLISPWVAATRAPVDFAPSAAEVQQVFQAPAAHFLDPAHRGQHVEQRGAVQFMAPHFQFHGHFIWGATAMILAELVEVVATIVS